MFQESWFIKDPTGHSSQVKIKSRHLLSVVGLGDEAEHVGDGLREGGHRGDELQLPGESPTSEEPRDGDDGGVQHVHEEAGEGDLLPRHAPHPEHLEEGLGHVEQGVQGDVHPGAEEALLEVERSVTPRDLGAERHGLAQLPLAAPQHGSVQSLEVINDFPQSTLKS